MTAPKMIMYSIDFGRRMYTVLFLVCVLAAAIDLGLRREFNLPGQYAAVLALVFFLIFFYLFDKFLWKLPGFRILNYGMVNVAGEWKGTITQATGEGPKPLPATLVIAQTWSTIGLLLTTEQAVSQAVMAQLLGADPAAIKLSWTYRIEGSNAKSLADPGQGVIELTLTRGPQQMQFEGSFFSSQLDDHLALVRQG